MNFRVLFTVVAIIGTVIVWIIERVDISMFEADFLFAYPWDVTVRERFLYELVSWMSTLLIPSTSLALIAGWLLGEREYIILAALVPLLYFITEIVINLFWVQATFKGTPLRSDQPRGVPRNETARVDVFSPNPWGLYHVHGNVWEWTETCWSEGSGQTTDCTNQVIAGGSWNSDAAKLQSGSRDKLHSLGARNDVGFRLAKSL